MFDNCSIQRIPRVCVDDEAKILITANKLLTIINVKPLKDGTTSPAEMNIFKLFISNLEDNFRWIAMDL